jgi:aerobic carbon-monoxide dehydrogenase large subunit
VIDVIRGTASIGQGIDGAMTQICAETLCAPARIIRVILGQTDRITRDLGAFASRVVETRPSVTTVNIDACN